jgi:hypothetical protein
MIKLIYNPNPKLNELNKYLRLPDRQVLEFLLSDNNGMWYVCNEIWITASRVYVKKFKGVIDIQHIAGYEIEIDK